MGTRNSVPIARLAAVSIAAVLLAAGSKRPTARSQGPSQLVILVSLDGFHPAYLDRYAAPNLRRLARGGVRARWMVPVFPPNTFPSHYSIVTGLLPAHHGIVNNQFIDPTDGARFRYSDTAISRQGRWWQGEPVWVTVERQGLRAASFFWPGSDVNDPAKRPGTFKPFDRSVPDTARVDSVLAWLARPEAERPRFVTLYFEEVDSRGHELGTEAPELGRYVRRADAMIGRLRTGLRRLGLEDRANLIVVSDHGLAQTSPERQVVLEDYLDRTAVDVISLGATIFLRPRGNTSAADVVRALAASPHLRVYEREATPERWRVRGSPRVAEVVGVAETGWRLTTRGSTARERAAHGFDNQDSTMRALFLAAGPAFRRGVVAGPLSSLHVYELVCRILGVRPAPNDGSVDSIVGMLR